MNRLPLDLEDVGRGFVGLEPMPVLPGLQGGKRHVRLVEAFRATLSAGGFLVETDGKANPIGELEPLDFTRINVLLPIPDRLTRQSEIGGDVLGPIETPFRTPGKEVTFVEIVFHSVHPIQKVTSGTAGCGQEC